MKRLFSGIQPSGNLHLGNYLGAIKQWIDLQDDYEAFFCVVDLHAITVPQDPAELRKKILEIAKIYLAAGVNPEKSTIFIQSQVAGHAELGWILNTITHNGELARMTQFKSKTGINIKGDILALIRTTIDDINNSINRNDKLVERKNDLYTKLNYFTELLEKTSINSTEKIREYLSLLVDINKQEIDWREDWMENVHKKLVIALAEYTTYENSYNSSDVGLFDYPVLMAADILLYDTAVVPVGEDQKQHVELTRDLAQRFNNRFGETFVVPEPLIRKEGARIMALDDPTKKMSKSAASEYNYIALTDDADAIRKKIKKAVTDSGSEIVYSDDPVKSDASSDHGASKPALRNLINIYSLLSNKMPQEIVEMYRGKGYSNFKADLAEVVVNFLVPFQERLAQISDDEALAVLRSGAEKAKALSEQKISEVYSKVGLIR